MLKRIIINCDPTWAFIPGCRERFLDLYREKADTTLLWDACGIGPREDADRRIWGDWPTNIGGMAGNLGNTLRAALQEEIEHSNWNAQERTRFLILFVARDIQQISNQERLIEGRLSQDFFADLKRDLNDYHWQNDSWIVLITRTEHDLEQAKPLINSGYIGNLACLSDQEDPRTNNKEIERKHMDALRAVIDIYGSEDGWERIRRRPTNSDRMGIDYVKLPEVYQERSSLFRKTVLDTLKAHYKAIWAQGPEAPTASEKRNPRLIKLEDGFSRIEGILDRIASQDQESIEFQEFPAHSYHVGEFKRIMAGRARFGPIEPSDLGHVVSNDYLTSLHKDIQQRSKLFIQQQGRRLEEMHRASREIESILAGFTITNIGIGDPVIAALDKDLETIKRKEDDLSHRIEEVHRIVNRGTTTTAHVGRFGFLSRLSEFFHASKAWRDYAVKQEELVKLSSVNKLARYIATLVILTPLFAFFTLILSDNNYDNTILFGVIGAATLALPLTLGVGILVVRRNALARIEQLRAASSNLQKRVHNLTNAATVRLYSTLRYPNLVKARELASQTRNRLFSLRGEVGFSRDYIYTLESQLGSGVELDDNLTSSCEYLSNKPPEDWLDLVLERAELPEQHPVHFNYLAAAEHEFPSRFFDGGMPAIQITQYRERSQS